MYTWRPILLVFAMMIMASAGIGSTSQQVTSHHEPLDRTIAASMETLDLFAHQQFDDAQPINGWTTVTSAMTVIGTSCQPIFSNNSAYCKLDKRLYFGEDFSRFIDSVTGQIGVFFVAGHEYAHHLQDIRYANTAWRDETLRKAVAAEDQADCYGGAFVMFAHRLGVIDDPRAIDWNPLVSFIASPDKPWRNHGNYFERMTALNTGIDGGIEACRDY